MHPKNIEYFVMEKFKTQQRLIPPITDDIFYPRENTCN